MLESEREAVETLQRMHPQWLTEAGARNQCNIASDALIGRVVGAQRIWVDDGAAHCMVLLPSGAIVDLTSVQFGTPESYADVDELLRHWTRYKVALVHYDLARLWLYRPGVVQPPEPEVPELPVLTVRNHRSRVRATPGSDR